MKRISKIIVAIAALGLTEWAGAGSPVSSVATAHAQTMTAEQRTALQDLTAKADAAHRTKDIYLPDTIIRGYGSLNSLKATLATYPASGDPDLAKAQTALANFEKRLRASSNAAFRSLKSASTTLQTGRDSLQKMTKSGGPSPLQDRAAREETVARYNKARAVVRNFANVKDPRVATANDLVGEFATAFKTEMARAQKQVEALGDLDKTLADLTAQIDATAKSHPVPAPLTAPFTSARIKDWQTAALKAREAGNANLAAIKAVTDTMATPAKFDPLIRTERKRIAAIDTNAKPILAHMLEGIPESPDDKRLLTPFIDSGDHAGASALLDDSVSAITRVMAFETAIGNPVSRWQRTLARIAKTRVQFEKDFKRGRLPSPKSTDPTLIAAAKDILARPKYAFGEHGPIILTTEGVTTREKEESRTTYTDADVSGNGDITLTGTKETWVYKWQEFRFATPIKNDDGSWNIWWITAKNFSSHWDSKLTNRWISSKTVKGSPIPESRFK